jgi:hypothetical protein
MLMSSPTTDEKREMRVRGIHRSHNQGIVLQQGTLGYVGAQRGNLARVHPRQENACGALPLGQRVHPAPTRVRVDEFRKATRRAVKACSRSNSTDPSEHTRKSGMPNVGIHAIVMRAAVASAFSF